MKNIVLSVFLLIFSFRVQANSQVKIMITEGDGKEVVEVVLKADQVKEVPRLGVVEIHNIRFESSSLVRGLTEFRVPAVDISANELCTYLGYEGAQEILSSEMFKNFDGSFTEDFGMVILNENLDWIMYDTQPVSKGSLVKVRDILSACSSAIKDILCSMSREEQGSKRINTQQEVAL